MALIPQVYSDAVVAIGSLNNAGQKVWQATGFVAARKNENGGYNTFLVTNKHVLDCHKKHILLRFNVSGKIDAKDYTVTLIDDSEKKLFSMHPTADVACILLNTKVLSTDLGKISAFELENMALTREEMIHNEVIEGSIVYSLGFPSGLVGVDSKVPPRAPKEQSKDCSFFVQSILAQTSENDWIFCFLEPDQAFLPDRICFVCSCLLVSNVAYFVVNSPSRRRIRF